MSEQQIICKKYDSKWSPVNKIMHVGISNDLTSQPLNGLRHKPEKGTTGWYIWAGNYSEDKDFFKPLHAVHLLQINPKIIKYLGLAPGYRLQIDNTNYEDVWFDEKLLNK
ncbi:MAG: hypothetical protein EOP00_25435 [Pedobacter sp.]|nr:MAG: hypothetical protein EOP00_25435 [Pedobacter sp.]